MSRPIKKRTVQEPPKIQGMKPIGVPASFLENIVLSIDEYEAIRLADYEGLEHEKAAEIMGISRPTFSRLIDKARSKLADSIVAVKELIIEGGSFSFVNDLIRCLDCGEISRFVNPNFIPETCPNCKSANIVNLNQWFSVGRGHRRGGRGFRGGHGGW
ncbi:MAG: hypothetical protein DRP89_02510 [Candidatus Neomarinimicrobiota bacterium]|nr:MAG: hypothetical protein DRP89_02510 [Candidatus Neomarinimicrobiota bacterium]